MQTPRSGTVAMFTSENGLYHPANAFSVGVCALLSKRFLKRMDILNIKQQGIRVIEPNGTEILIVENA